MTQAKQKAVGGRLGEKLTSQGSRNDKPNKKDSAAKSLTQDDIHIDPNYEQLVPRPTTEEYEALRASIEKDGQRDPIIVNKGGVVLDGHTRFKILKEMNVLIQFEVRSFPNRQAEKNFVIEAATIRRDLNIFQKVKMLLPVLEIEQAKAVVRQKSGIRTSVSNDTQVDSGRATEIVARRFGIPIATFERARYVLENARPELISAIEKGEESIGGIYKVLREEVKKNKKDTDESPSNPSPEAGIVSTDLKPSSLEKVSDEASHKPGESKIDRHVICESCGGETKRGEAKKALLCKNCREKLGMTY